MMRFLLQKIFVCLVLVPACAVSMQSLGTGVFDINALLQDTRMLSDAERTWLEHLAVIAEFNQNHVLANEIIQRLDYDLCVGFATNYEPPSPAERVDWRLGASAGISFFRATRLATSCTIHGRTAQAQGAAPPAAHAGMPAVVRCRMLEFGRYECLYPACAQVFYGLEQLKEHTRVMHRIIPLP